MKPKVYKTYTALAQAFKSGELDKKHYYMMLDKSGTENCLCYRNDDEDEKFNDLMNERCRDMWPDDPPIEGLFEALGIPAEWC